MISGIFHKGSGLGNQLHRYVATRVLALDRGYEFSMVAPENFKGKGFMNLDMGKQVGVKYVTEPGSGRVIPQDDLSEHPKWFFTDRWLESTPYYNPEFNFIKDGALIDGEFQDERYFEHRLDDIDKWLKVDWPFEGVKQHDLCAIGFRGGEFYVFPELGLPKEYFDEAIEIITRINPLMRFEVHTDDPKLAQKFFPAFPIIHDISLNWRTMRYARYAIIANSSFYILPRLLMHHGHASSVTIAPRYWARRNTGEWSMPQNYYKNFTYI